MKRTGPLPALIFAALGAAVASIDVGVDSIIIERRQGLGAELFPAARWRNNGDTAVDVMTWFSLTNPEPRLVYTESLHVPALPPGRDTVLVFPPHMLRLPTGLWWARCSTYAPGDTVPANDTLSYSFFTMVG